MEGSLTSSSSSEENEPPPSASTPASRSSRRRLSRSNGTSRLLDKTYNSGSSSSSRDDKLSRSTGTSNLLENVDTSSSSSSELENVVIGSISSEDSDSIVALSEELDASRVPPSGPEFNSETDSSSSIEILSEDSSEDSSEADSDDDSLPEPDNSSDIEVISEPGNKYPEAEEFIFINDLPPMTPDQEADSDVDGVLLPLPNNSNNSPDVLILSESVHHLELNEELEKIENVTFSNAELHLRDEDGDFLPVLEADDGQRADLADDVVADNRAPLSSLQQNRSRGEFIPTEEDSEMAQKRFKDRFKFSPMEPMVFIKGEEPNRPTIAVVEYNHFMNQPLLYYISSSVASLNVMNDDHDMSPVHALVLAIGKHSLSVSANTIRLRNDREEALAMADAHVTLQFSFRKLVETLMKLHERGPEALERAQECGQWCKKRVKYSDFLLDRCLYCKMYGAILVSSKVETAGEDLWQQALPILESYVVTPVVFSEKPVMAYGDVSYTWEVHHDQYDNRVQFPPLPPETDPRPGLGQAWWASSNYQGLYRPVDIDGSPVKCAEDAIEVSERLTVRRNLKNIFLRMKVAMLKTLFGMLLS